MALSFLYWAFVRVHQLVRLLCRTDADLAIEVVMLRHEATRSRYSDARSTVRRCSRPTGPCWPALWRLLPRLRQRRGFVQPATLLRWHRDLVAKRWTCPHGRPSRPAGPLGTTALILQLVKENRENRQCDLRGPGNSLGQSAGPPSSRAFEPGDQASALVAKEIDPALSKAPPFHLIDEDGHSLPSSLGRKNQ